MDQQLVKKGFYGFIIGLAIGVLIVNYSDVVQVNDSRIKTYQPVMDYVISVLRLGVIGMFVGIFMGWKRYEKEKGEKSYYLPVFLTVFICSLILMVGLSW